MSASSTETITIQSITPLHPLPNPSPFHHPTKPPHKLLKLLNLVPPPAGSQPPTFTLSLNLLFALASCITGANVYWNQAILPKMGETFGVGTGDIGTVSTATTMGYAVGLLVVTPLGDMSPLSPSVITNVELEPHPTKPSFLLGTITVTPHILIPLVADLAPPPTRGKATGIVMSGLMLGITGARVVSGLIARHTSWRVVYYLSSVLNFLVLILLIIFLPAISRQTRITYGELMKSLYTLLREEVVLDQASGIMFLLFAGFQLFWTVVPFHLRNDFGSKIGLYGLIGIAGIVGAPLAGHISDVFGVYPVIAFELLLFGISLVIMLVGSRQIAAMVVGGFMLDLSMQTCQVSSQIRIHSLLPSSRSRLTALLMVLAFLGGSVGSAAGSNLYQHRGWLPAIGLALAFLGLAVILHFIRTPAQVGLVPGWMKGGKWWVGVERSRRFVEQEGKGKVEGSGVEEELEEVVVDDVETVVDLTNSWIT
ncbi:hypothetical protein HDV00_008572 [Rhizophlyctis rosea]|nr:hypothetical protein HDV00_008572 [Rhizophlyctis rosea]